MPQRFFRIGLVIVVLSLSGITPTAVGRAQGDPMRWYFAIDRDEGTLIAYQLDGTVQMVPDTLVYTLGYGWRVAPDTALALLYRDETWDLALVTPDAEQVFATAAEWPTLDFGDLMAVASSGDYLVLTDNFEPGGVALLLVNVATGAVDLVAHDVVQSYAKMGVVFSEDGAELRFWSRSEADRQQWQLIVYDVATGATSIRHTLTHLGFPPVYPDTHGDHWLSVEQDANTMATIYALLHIDGTREELHRHTQGDYETDESRAAMRRFIMFEDSLMSFPETCEAGCPLTVTPLDGGAAQTFILPQTRSWLVRPGRWLPDGRLAVVAGDSADMLWLLSPDGEAQYLGAWSTHYGLEPREAVSPDGRWAITCDQPGYADRFQIWDVRANKQVMDVAVNAGIIPYFYSDHVVVRIPGSPGRVLVYDAQRDTLTEIPEPSSGLFHPLPDGTLLYEQRGSDPYLAQGIYHHDPATDEFTLLVPNATAVWVDAVP